MFICNLTKSFIGLLVAGALTPAGALAASTNAAPATKPSLKASDLFGDNVVAKGKGVEIKRSQLDDEVVRVKSQIAARGQVLPPENAAMLEQGILDQLIQIQLLQAKASDADKASGKTAAEKQLAEAKTQAGSEEALNVRLKAQNITREELITKWTEAETAKACLVRELKIEIPSADIKKFYDDNPSYFEEPEMVRASHILLSTRDIQSGKELSEDAKAAKRKQAEDLLKRARAGEDFAQLAKEYSEDPGSKEKGGEYTFPRGQMVKEFEIAAFALKPNEVSDIVTTQFGYHIIKLSEKLPARKRALTDVSPRIQDHLTQQAIAKQAPDYIEQLKKDAKVEILDESLKPKPKPDSGQLPTGLSPSKPEAK